MISIFEPIAAGIVVALFNKFVLNGSWMRRQHSH